MNAVIYARYSSDNQREESIEGQIRECLAFAERKGYTVIKTYADRAISGKKAENRPEFMQMISDSSQGEFEAVIVWKIDRFSRDKYDSVMYKSKLNKNGVSVISATEPIDDSPEGKLMESIFEGFSEYYVKDLVQKTTRGMTENAIKGKFNGGIVTFGYVIDRDGYFAVEPVSAKIVKDIFNRYSGGETIKSIIADLNGKGLKNNGKDFSYHFINGLLKNRRYIGEYTFKDIINTDAIPAIITPDIFEKCQERLSSNCHKPASFRAVDDKFLLTGKIICGNCGDVMSGTGGTGKSKKVYRYYQCHSSRKKLCGGKRIKKEPLEKAVLFLVMQIFKDEALIKQICDTCYSLQTTENSQLPALKKQLKQNKKEIDNIMKAIMAGIVTKSTKATLEKLEQEQEALEIKIAQEQIKRPIISKEQIEAWIMNFAKTDLSNQEQKQKIIDIFVNSIYVYDDKLVVLLNYKDGEKCLSFDEIENGIKKENTQNIECSSLINVGDPYGS